MARGCQSRGLGVRQRFVAGRQDGGIIPSDAFVVTHDARPIPAEGVRRRGQSPRTTGQFSDIAASMGRASNAPRICPAPPSNSFSRNGRVMSHDEGIEGDDSSILAACDEALANTESSTFGTPGHTLHPPGRTGRPAKTHSAGVPRHLPVGRTDAEIRYHEPGDSLRPGSHVPGPGRSGPLPNDVSKSVRNGRQDHQRSEANLLAWMASFAPTRSTTREKSCDLAEFCERERTDETRVMNTLGSALFSYRPVRARPRAIRTIDNGKRIRMGRLRPTLSRHGHITKLNHWRKRIVSTNRRCKGYKSRIKGNDFRKRVVVAAKIEWNYTSYGRKWRNLRKSIKP